MITALEYLCVMAPESSNASRRMSNESFESAYETLLSEDAYNNEYSRELFEAIDQLRSCGADRDIELPEVCAVCPLPRLRSGTESCSL